MPRAVKKKSQWKVYVQVLQLTPKLHRRIKAARTVPEAKCNRWAVFGHFLLLQREWKPLLSVVSEQNSQPCKSKTKPLVCCAQRLKRKWEFSLLWWGNPPKLTHTETCTAKIEGKNNHRNCSSSMVWTDHCWLTRVWFVHLTSLCTYGTASVWIQTE